MIRSIAMVLMLSVVSVPAFAAEAAKADQAAQPVAVNNKLCPVSGEEVGKMGDPVTIEHNGKIYNLCCSMCAKDFKKNPEKYSKIAEDEVAAQTK